MPLDLVLLNELLKGLKFPLNKQNHIQSNVSQILWFMRRSPRSSIMKAPKGLREDEKWPVNVEQRGTRSRSLSAETHTAMLIPVILQPKVRHLKGLKYKLNYPNLVCFGFFLCLFRAEPKAYGAGQNLVYRQSCILSGFVLTHPTKNQRSLMIKSF